MLRKTMALLIALALLCVAPALSEDAPAPNAYVAEDMFSFEYPAEWEKDDETYDDENETGYIWVTDVYVAGDINVICSATYVDSWRGITLRDADEAGVADYKANLDEYYYDQSGVYLSTVYAGDGGIPFIVYTTTDYYGVSLQASTLVNGWEVAFEMYAERAMTSSDRQTLYDIVSSFALLSEPSDAVWSAPDASAGGGMESADGGYTTL